MDEWKDYAACRDADPDIFFPEGQVGILKSQKNISQAKKFCVICPVRERCLEEAITHNIQYGVWGGQTVRERRETRKQWRMANKL